MKWQEVRELFHNQFVLVSIIDFHEEGDKKLLMKKPLYGQSQIRMQIKHFSRQKKGQLFIIRLVRNLSFIFEETRY